MKIFTAVAAFVLVFFALQQLLIPKYASEVFEGNLIREYYDSRREHDVIFIGDCEVYAGFSPVVLWEEQGITSFIRGSAQQLIWQSYYLLEETLRHETPSMVVFNVLAMQYNEPQYEPYNRLTLDGMRWSVSKLRAVRASSFEDESLFSYVFPFFRFKDRWRELGTEDFRYFWSRPQVSINGFMIRTDVQPAVWIPDPLPRASWAFGDKAFEYLQKMVELTRAHGVEFVLVKAPTIFPVWMPQWNEQIVSFAEENGLVFINFLEYTNDIGLDFEFDTFDGGGTLNLFGAEKLTRFFGEMLRERDDLPTLPDRRGEPAVAAYWAELSALYHRNVARQQAESAEFGRILSFLIEY